MLRRDRLAGLVAGLMSVAAVALMVPRAGVEPAALLLRGARNVGLPVAQAVPLDAAGAAMPSPTRRAARAPRRKPVGHPRAGNTGASAPSQANAPRVPPKSETEQQALRRARVEAQRDYLRTYNMAVRAENAAEAQERTDRAARIKHNQQRHKFYGALKTRADTREGWVKLQREMGMIMDGVDGLHYKGYGKH